MTSLLPTEPPPGPTRPDFWRSPLRGRWLTTVLGTTLLCGVAVVALTGFLSHAAYQPSLGANGIVPVDRDLVLIPWPTSPSWLYVLTQGLHVTGGIVIVPLLLAKLWSVIPRLYAWPPVAGPADALGRVATLALVGSALFQFATGITNVQLYYPWHFDFVVAHYYGAWVFLAALALHIGVQLPTMRQAWTTRDEVAAVTGADHLRAPAPGETTISRRGLFAFVGGASGLLFLTTAGQSIGGAARQLAIFAPRGRGESFPVNKTASVAKVTPAMVGAMWRLELSGDRALRLSREELLAMEQHTYALPIACVEGWSTTQTWTGVRLRDLAALAGVPDAEQVRTSSLQPRGRFRRATLGHAQVHDERSLLALRVNGEDLPLDHGYPARIIVPALPGVHCTKWVKGLAFS
ncbi:MAG: molybdopterin-dependent oxidoreductase [Solirubrobacteraceae bacterium]|nr:molybdopterin-dependent oxidoreductase [Solirubrobacteraceae bacterium]